MLAYQAEDTGVVTAACLERYRNLGIPSELLPWQRLDLDEEVESVVSVIRADNRLDWVLGDADARPFIEAFRRLAGQGFANHVLVPMELLGEAHRALRGTPVLLQGFWEDGDGVHFWRPEIP